MADMIHSYIVQLEYSAKDFINESVSIINEPDSNLII